MASQVTTTTISEPVEQDFNTSQVLTVASGHFIHDIFTSFLAPLLPTIIDKLSLSLTQAGSLSSIMQLPSLLNPLIGYMDDRLNLRLLVILAPGVTATLMSSLGLASNFVTLAVLLFVTGFSVAMFHAPAPAIVARVSGKQVGRGMSLFMAGGELSRSVGPLVAVWAVSILTLNGIFVLSVGGWAATAILFLRFRKIVIRPQKRVRVASMFPSAYRLFAPMLIVIFARSFLVICLSLYLPTLLESEGASLLAAGSALALYQLAGVFGALSSGSISDRIGRKPVVLLAMTLSSLLMVAFLSTAGFWRMLVLLILGFIALSAQPVLMALVQDCLPEHRSIANGFFMTFVFIMSSIASILVGALGDRVGLHNAFLWTAFISLIAIPGILLLPSPRPRQESAP